MRQVRLVRQVRRQVRQVNPLGFERQATSYVRKVLQVRQIRQVNRLGFERQATSLVTTSESSKTSRIAYLLNSPGPDGLRDEVELVGKVPDGVLQHRDFLKQ